MVRCPELSKHRASSLGVHGYRCLAEDALQFMELEDVGLWLLALLRSQNSQTPAAIVEMDNFSTKKTGYPQIGHFDGVGYLKMDGYRKTKICGPTG